MVEIDCLWCAATLAVDGGKMEQVQTCPECLSSWVFEDEPESELALAA